MTLTKAEIHTRLMLLQRNIISWEVHHSTEFNVVHEPFNWHLSDLNKFIQYCESDEPLNLPLIMQIRCIRE